MSRQRVTRGDISSFSFVWSVACIEFFFFFLFRWKWFLGAPATVGTQILFLLEKHLPESRGERWAGGGLVDRWRLCHQPLSRVL